MEPHTPLLLLLNPRAPVPKAAPLHFEHTLAQRQLGTHPLWGPHGGAVIFQPHSHSMPLQGQPRRRAPLQRLPSPRDARAQLQTATLRSRPRGWVSGSRRGSRERARPRPRPPHSRSHTPARARPHTRAQAQHTGPQTDSQRLRVGTQPDSPLKAPSATPPRPAPRTRQSGRHSVGCKVCSVRQSRERAGAGSTGLHEAPDSCDRWSRGVDALRTALPLRANPTTSSRVTGAVRVPHGPSNLRRGAQPTLSPPCLSSWTQTLHHRHSAMASRPARISLGSQLLPMVPLLLLLQGADCGHRGPSLSSLPLAAEGLQRDKDPQQSPGDASTALGPGAQDMVAVHMLRLYEKYNRRGARPGGGNTVRSFRARLGK